MKRSLRLTLTGSVQGMLFEQYIKEYADRLNVRGFMRKLENGNVEIFIEGDQEKVDEMASICRRGSRHTQVRSVVEKPESFQGFKEFKVLRI